MVITVNGTLIDQVQTFNSIGLTLHEDAKRNNVNSLLLPYINNAIIGHTMQNYSEASSESCKNNRLSKYNSRTESNF